jgi:succinate-semialdehyde dehydrogenase/glutarate-semialdehyde dehydrogenase
MSTIGFDPDLPELVRTTEFQVPLFIDGKWKMTEGVFEVCDPATLERAAVVADAEDSDMDAALGAAADAFAKWRHTVPCDRQRLLLEIGRLMDRDRERIAALLTLETGKPLAEARGEVAYARDFAYWYAEEARRIRGYTMPAGSRPGVRLSVTRFPVGVVLAVVPWNYPVVLLCRKLFAALAAGNAVVIKPSEKTPIASSHLMRLIDEAGAPPGLVNHVTVADGVRTGQLLRDRRVAHISFTGSVGVGKALARIAAENLTRLTLELGGHNAFIVTEDCDVQAAADAAMHARLRNGGQTCVSPNRLFVAEPVYEEFVEACATVLQGCVVGDGFSPASTIGPLIDDAAARNVANHVNDAVDGGAIVRYGGGDVSLAPELKGYFVRPVLLTNVRKRMRVLTEETFGPVAPIIPFVDVSDAIEEVNASEYGLAAYVYSDNVRTVTRLAEELEAGMVVVNQAAGSGVEAPQGGVKLSGYGLEGGKEGLEEFTYQKYVSLAT